jgi:hypothetical protein
MQVIFPFNQAADLRSMRDRMVARFEKIRVEERPDPVSQMVSSFIGSRTYDWKSWDASTAETRWLVRGAALPIQSEDWGYPAFKVDLVRNRHGKTGRCFMEWNCDGRVFQSSTADHRVMVSAAAN